MGSVQESGLKCPICGKNRLLSDYYYKTQEHYEFCEACGFQQSITILRDDAGNVMRREVGSYPLDGSLCLVLKNAETKEVLEKTPIRPAMSEDEIYSALNRWRRGISCGIYLDGDFEHLKFHRLSSFCMKEIDGTVRFIVSDPIWQLRLEAVNRDGIQISVRPKAFDMPDHPPDARRENDLYQFTVGPKESDTRAEYLLPVQAMNDTGLLRLIEHPEILADNWGESA